MRICSLPFTSGIGTTTCLSNLPGRTKAFFCCFVLFCFVLFCFFFLVFVCVCFCFCIWRLKKYGDHFVEPLSRDSGKLVAPITINPSFWLKLVRESKGKGFIRAEGILNGRGRGTRPIRSRVDLESS